MEVFHSSELHYSHYWYSKESAILDVYPLIQQLTRNIYIIIIQVTNVQNPKQDV